MSRASSSVLALSALLISGVISGVAIECTWAADAPDRRGPAAAPPAAPVDLQNPTCPVKRVAVVPGVTETVGGAIVHFCCTGCAAKYRANPAAYETALRSDPAVARRLDLARANAEPRAAAPADASSTKDLALHDGMRKLWEDHVVWTRLFIVSAAADLPDRDAVTNRLLRNQSDIGDAIKPYYGAEAATELTRLLKEHITIAAELVDASVASDAAKAETANTKWGTNADEIAAFLSKANPTAWPLDHMKSMMHEHLELTAAEAKARITKDWEADIAAYDKAREQALKMADMLSDGIRKQFPQTPQ